MNARKSSTTSVVRATPRTKPVTDFRTLLLDSLTERWQTLRSELKRCQKQYSEEAVHDLRVATRRLISTLDLLASVLPEAKLRKARRALKKQLEMLGPLGTCRCSCVPSRRCCRHSLSCKASTPSC